MSRYLSRAEWLTANQALELLQEHDKTLTMEGMSSYCTELKLFRAYVRLRMVKGQSLDDRSSVYGLGEYQVLNPEGLLHGPEETTLYLYGDVFDVPDPAASKIRDVEWELHAHRSALRILFKRSELEKLNSSSEDAAIKISTVQNEPSANHLIVISKLVQMLKDDSRPRYNQESIIAAIEKDYGCILGLGSTTLRTLLATANKARKIADNEKNHGGSKIRLDKKEIQLD